MVRVDEPEPTIEGGLKPPLVMPVGNPDSLPTPRLTVPMNPMIGVTVTVNVVDWPGVTDCAAGLTAIEKSAVGGVTVMVRVGGLGSELPLESITVSEGVCVPGGVEGTFPGYCADEVAGDARGKIHECLAAAMVVPK